MISNAKQNILSNLPVVLDYLRPIVESNLNADLNTTLNNLERSPYFEVLTGLNKYELKPKIRNLNFPSVQNIIAIYVSQPSGHRAILINNVITPEDSEDEEVSITKFNPETTQTILTKDLFSLFSEDNPSFTLSCFILVKTTSVYPSITIPSCTVINFSLRDILGYIYYKFSNPILYLEKNRVNIIGIRSMLGVEFETITQNGITYQRAKSYKWRNTFEDFLIMFYKDDSGVFRVKQLNCTTFPGAYQAKQQGTDYGLGIVAEGQHVNCYKLDKHKGRSNHNALRQSRKMIAYRDNVFNNDIYELKLDRKFDHARESSANKIAGFNIHTCLSGNTTTMDKIQPEDIIKGYSAGCQTVVIDSHTKWESDVISILKRHDDAYKFKHKYRDKENVDYANFSYILIEEWSFVQYLKLREVI